MTEMIVLNVLGNALAAVLGISVMLVADREDHRIVGTLAALPFCVSMWMVTFFVAAP